MKKLFKFCNTGRSQNGFTLIEMIVVVAIIGVLATAVIMSLMKAQAKARDSERTAELKQVQTAVEMHKEVKGTFPGRSSNTYTSYNNWEYQGSGPTNNNLATDLQQFLSPLPREPKCGFLSCDMSVESSLMYKYIYYNRPDLKVVDYELDSGMEVRSDLVANDGGALNSSNMYGKALLGRYELGSKLFLLDCALINGITSLPPEFDGAVVDIDLENVCIKGKLLPA